MKCALCGEREATDVRCRQLGAPPMCQLCHANRRLVWECPCLTTEQAISISARETDPDAAKRALAEIAAVLR